MKTKHLWPAAAIALTLTACGDSAPGPTVPSAGSSFLAGTWQGTMTIQVNPDVPGAPPASSAPTTWIFETVPQTNLQTFKATVRSQHSWLPIDTSGTTAVIPGNAPPVQISTQGDYSSPRGCRGTFASAGVATATEIDADFHGVDCGSVTFTGHVTLTKR
jgi:hypothetical protein